MDRQAVASVENQSAALCVLSLTWLGCLREASFVVLTNMRWQAATLSGESKQYVFVEASRPLLDHGWVPCRIPGELSPGSSAQTLP